MKKGQKSSDPKYLKNHPDITGMMSDSGKDKDEEEMLNDISGKGNGEDPTDSIDREMEDKPDKKKPKENKPKEKANIQTEVSEQNEEDADLQEFIQAKEKESEETEKHKGYKNSKAYKEQKQLLNQIEKVYKDDKYDAQKKVMTFTSEVCMPEILKLQKK